MNVTEFRAASLTVTESLKHIILPETPTTPSDNERHAPHRQPDATKVSELHLYLPSSLCDDEEQDADTEEMRYELSLAVSGAWRLLRVIGEQPSASFS